MILKSDAKFEEKLIRSFKNDKNLMNFDPSTQNSPNLHIDWSLLCKVYNVWPEKYRGVILHYAEESHEIWRKSDVLFEKWHE